MCIIAHSIGVCYEKKRWFMIKMILEQKFRATSHTLPKLHRFGTTMVSILHNSYLKMNKCHTILLACRNYNAVLSSHRRKSSPVLRSKSFLCSSMQRKNFFRSQKPNFSYYKYCKMVLLCHKILSFLRFLFLKSHWKLYENAEA